MPPHPPGCNCGDDDAHVILDGTQDFLYSKIDRDRVVALNSEHQGKAVIKPWDDRLQEEPFVESDSDEQLILQIPFTGSIKLRSILIKSGPGGHTPDKMQVFVNQALDFDEASSVQVTQSFDVAQTKDVIELAVRPAKFPSVRSLTLFFPSNHGEDTTRISFIGFKGEYSPMTRDPIITVYEAQANPADHPKVQGTGMEAHSRLG